MNTGKVRAPNLETLQHVEEKRNMAGQKIKRDEHREANTESAKMGIAGDLERSQLRGSVRLEGPRKQEIRKWVQFSQFHDVEFFKAPF